MTKSSPRDHVLQHDAECDDLDLPSPELALLLKSRAGPQTHEQAGAPTSKLTRNPTLSRPHSDRMKRAKSRQSVVSSRKAQIVKTSKDSLDLARLNSIFSSSLSIPNVGQLNLLPIKCTQDVQGGVQYYIESYARYVVQRPRFAGQGTDWGLLEELVPFTLSDSMVLTSTVALMEVIQNRGKAFGSGMTKSVMRNITNAIAQLKTKLISPTEGLGDNVILAILNLCAIEFHEMDHRSLARLNIHMPALARIVQLRGGRDNLGFDGYLSYTAFAYTHLWQSAIKDLSNPPIAKSDLVYPTHPFSPELCKKISQLPDGFHEPILDCHFLIPLIDITHQLHVASRQPDVSFEVLSQVCRNCTWLLRQELSIFERIVNLGLVAFDVHVDNTKVMYRMLKPVLQVQSRAAINSNVDLSVRYDSHRKILIWASCLLVATTQWGSWSSRLGNKVLTEVAPGMSWEKRTAPCKEFFWDAMLTQELTSKILGQGQLQTRGLQKKQQR